MFTGITTDVGEIVAIRQQAEGLKRLRIACAYPRASIIEGASIACAGICLTAVGTGETGGRNWFAVDVAAETLAVTTAGRWKPGTKINLERSLRLGDELGGHLVSGHVDGLAQLIAREDLTDMARMTFRAPRPLVRFIAHKGSVTLDGVSLTINAVAGDTFAVLIIPHSLQATTLGGLRQGDDVNLEIDTLARYAARLAETR